MDKIFVSRINDIYSRRLNPQTHIKKNQLRRKQVHRKEKTSSGTEPEGTVTEVMGTTIIDPACSPSNIRYPQDYSLLNEAREKLEEMIDFFHREYVPWKKPRTH